MTHPTQDVNAAAVVIGLFHTAIKTANLAASLQFYKGILGLREIHRPDFGFPGAWLACPSPGGAAIIHLYAGGPALGAGGTGPLDTLNASGTVTLDTLNATGKVPLGSAAVDHVSLACSGFHAFRSRIQAAGLAWREQVVPGTTLWQLFVYDPSGVQFELTFEGAVEPGALPDMSPGRVYVAGVNFFAAPTP